MMKRCVPIFVMLLFGLWLGCGGNEEGPTDNGGKPQRLVASTTVNEPTLDSVNDPVWSTVASVVVPVSQAGRPKLRPLEAAAVPPNITVKAIKKSGKLYLRLQWSDSTFDAYPDHYEVTEINTGGTLPHVLFDQKDRLVSQEDQVFVMFAGLPEGDYDVWNWRVLTTGGPGLGEGYNYLTTESLLVEDAAGTTTNPGIIINPETSPNSEQPTYARYDTSDFHGYVLYTDDAIHYLNDTLGIIIDSVIQPPDTIPIFFWNTIGWDTGQIVPGWLIDSTFDTLPAALGSRWDIRTVSEYDSIANSYQLVMCRKLDTDFGDDLVLQDSVKVKIGIYDSQDEFGGPGTADRGFSDVFWIILP
jgi:hypothetical protein